MKTVLAAVLLLCLPALGASAEEDGAHTSMEIVTKVRLTADRIEYSGLITAEANAGVFELYESAQPKPKALWIESQGGGASAGMQLGTWLFTMGWTWRSTPIASPAAPTMCSLLAAPRYSHLELR